MKKLRYTTDTTEDALQVQLACLRRMSPRERVQKTCAMSRHVRDMAMEAIRRRNPDWGDAEVRLMFIELTYGKSLAEDIRRWCSERDRAAEAVGVKDLLERTVGVAKLAATAHQCLVDASNQSRPRID